MGPAPQRRTGCAWIRLSPAPPDFEQFRSAMAPYFAPHALASAKVAFESAILENGDWKLTWANNRERCHCSPNHPELCRTFPEAATISGVSGAADDPFIAEHWARLEPAGLPSGFKIAADGQYRFTRMPLLDDATGYTMSGAPAVARPLSDQVTASSIGALLTFHYPSLWNHGLGAPAVSFRVLPVGPTQTLVTTKWLANAEAVEGVDYGLDELTKVWIATNDQDRRIIEDNQREVA